VKEAASKPKSDEKQAYADEVAALLNKEKASGGGAKRSTQQAALGGKRPPAAKLSQSEMDALRGQIQRCWQVPAGALTPRPARVGQDSLTTDRRLEGRPRRSSRRRRRRHRAGRRNPPSVPSAARPTICPPRNMKPGRMSSSISIRREMF
jgi:hypothetical protein